MRVAGIAALFFGLMSTAACTATGSTFPGLDGNFIPTTCANYAIDYSATYGDAGLACNDCLKLNCCEQDTVCASSQLVMIDGSPGTITECEAVVTCYATQCGNLPGDAGDAAAACESMCQASVSAAGAATFTNTYFQCVQDFCGPACATVYGPTLQ